MALSHIVMHVALCASVAREAANRDVPVRIVLTDKLQRTAFNQEFAIERGTRTQAPLEFDIPFGVYLAQVSTSTCGAYEFMSVIQDVNREVSISLEPGHAKPPAYAPAIVQGTAPFEYAYTQPTVMVFPHSVQCGGAIGDPLSADIDVENSSNSYYAMIYPTPELQRSAPVTLAVRFSDSHGGYQYLRVPVGDAVGYLTPWPVLGQLNVSAGLIDALAGKPEDTLICERMYKTTTYGQ